MDLTGLLPLIRDIPDYRKLVFGIKQGEGGDAVFVIDGAKPYLIAALSHDLKLPVLVVTAKPENGKRLYDQIQTWCRSSEVILFPEPDSLPFDRLATDSLSEMERLSVLASLVQRADKIATPVVIASAASLMQKVMPYPGFIAACQTIKTGTEITPFTLLARLEAAGYHLEGTVSAPGEMSHRGGIIDIYPPTGKLPVRLEFFGNTIDSIRLFDPGTQRSVGEVASVFICPATEITALQQKDRKGLAAKLGRLDLSILDADLKEQYRQDIALMLGGEGEDNLRFYAPLFHTGSLLDYLPENTIVLLDEPENIRGTTDNLDGEISNLVREKQARGELPGNFPVMYFKWEELLPKINEGQCLSLVSWGLADSPNACQMSFSAAPAYMGQLPVFIQKIKQLLEEKRRVIIITQQGARLAEMLGDAGIIAPALDAARERPRFGSLLLLQGSLSSGWVMDGKTCLFTDAEIFGFVKERRLSRRRLPARHTPPATFAPGDYLVHIEHGIARFLGVARMSGDGTEQEYLVLQYGSGDKLFVPADQIDRLSRYIGAGEEAPSLSRLGTQEWLHTKERARKAAEEIAGELLSLYAARRVVPGVAFSPDKPWQQELEASFPYVETRDQMTAIGKVKEDMMVAKPMDRLVLGDVGYGKTEVAVRAAFKAVLDGRQVAVLVPTTVLAEQHFITFSQRMEAFPVRIEVLSRFRMPKEQEKVLQGLADGSVDICIGTHRLLQKDVVFKDLGLLVIGEEQRFGVAHKEHLKQLRQNVDVLTLSATPIPRTLHMSLVGVRDISMIETPPEDRLPVKSYVARFDDHLVREAIMREMDRNGQVFFVHNRVQSIAGVAAKLRALVPGARIAVGHGQMDEEELEMVMRDFAQGESDILVCTTIIESGLDMPNVNTIIVNRADRMGLTQLYQLRGRVGRGAELAYAYFLFDNDRRLTPTAEKRLQTILEASDLGAGYSIAMRDLEIRGAGTLLGTKQSGFISAVGFDLYTRLLAQAVKEMKAKQAGEPVEPPAKLPPPRIDLPLSALLPEEYVPDIDTRLELYRRLGQIDKVEDVTEMASELADRFGKLPPAVENLLYAVRVKILAGRAGIESVSHETGYIVLKLFAGMEFEQARLEPFLKYGIKVGTNQLRINSRRRLGAEWCGVLEEILGSIN
ncbi:MAG: transcription-repair coupling factor [Chloroflexota bacterium]